MTQTLAPERRPRSVPAPARNVPPRSRPSPSRAAAAARVMGASAPLAAGVRAADVMGLPAPAPPDQPDGGRRGRHLQVVEKPVRTAAQRRQRARLMLFAGGAAVLAVSFALVYLHVLLAQRQFALDNMTTQLQKDQITYQKLRLQVAQLDSPDHIISTAEKLGMEQPQSVTYLTPSTTIAGSTAAGSSTNADQTLQEATPGAATSSSGGSATAPAGDADWPSIKSLLAGSP